MKTTNKNTLLNLPTLNRLDPWFVSGFVDGQGTFQLSLLKSKKLKTGWEVQPGFKIELHSKDFELLRLIRDFFRVGNLRLAGDRAIYTVRSLKDHMVILNHFDKFPLITKKQVDYKLFKTALHLIIAKEHITEKGLREIVSIRASLNRGLTSLLETSFPGIIPVLRPTVENTGIPSGQWLGGFTTGEGCFRVDIYNSKTLTGKAVTLRFKLTQDIRDKELLKSIIAYLGCGYLNKSGEDVVDLMVSSLEDHLQYILPFFKQNLILGNKALDFADWEKIANLMKNKAHLTQSGIIEIDFLRSGMNIGRT